MPSIDTAVASLCEYLERGRRDYPHRTAVVEHTGRAVTYAELADRASRVAGFLAASGVGKGARVGVVAPKSADVVAALLGIMQAGAAYVPADYTAPAPRNRMLLSDCEVQFLFLDPACAGIADEWTTAAPPSLVWLGAVAASPRSQGTSWAEVQAHAPLAETSPVDPDDLAYILYTSGSTGTPKGVALTHRNATSFVDWCTTVFAPTPEDRFSSHAPFHFDLSILDLYVPLKHGASVHLVAESVGKSPGLLAAFIAEHRLTVWYSTPSILTLLSQFGDLVQHDCSALRLVLFAGEVFPVKHLRRIVDLWPNALFYNLYGPTETNVCTFAAIPSPVPLDRVDPYPIGRLCAHCEGTVLDAPGGEEVATGEEGLLHIAGPSLFRGYWNRSNAGLFVERSGRRYYNTGDVVRESTDEGYVYVGRRDRMVKRRGYRIELAEIERALYQHESIRDAAVVAIPDASAGVRLVAHVVPGAGKRPSIVELKTFCGHALPAYMSPDVFVLSESLPRTSTDKVDYQALMRTSA